MSGDSVKGPKQLIYGQSVRPEPVSQKTLAEDITQIFNEVVFSNQSNYEGKEKILWCRFDECDVNDLSQFKEKIECNGNVPPFLLIVGYANGVQIWIIQASGVAIEVLSLRQGPVRTLKVLKTPFTSNEKMDKFSLKRPLIALCDGAGPGSQFHSVVFMSLRTGETVKTIKFKNAVQDVQTNKRVIIVSFIERLAVFEATTLDDLFTIRTCYKSPGLCLNPIALGDQWLAFADRKLHNTHQSCGGFINESLLSYKSSVISAAKSLTRGLKEFGETVATNFMGGKGTSPQNPQAPLVPSTTPGVVTIINTEKVIQNEVDLANGPAPEAVAHFVAHQGVPIVKLQFDPSGMLLATADKLGHSFNVFKIQCHPTSSAQSSIYHLYSLYRGDTTAKVLDITFALDSRWIAVATHRGTTHIYPIAPYGGTLSVRTHKSGHVINKLSQFHRSAGLDDSPSSGRNSPVLSSSPGYLKMPFESHPNIAYHNPYFPPYPAVTLVKALGRARPVEPSTLLEFYTPGQSPSHSPPNNKCSKLNSLPDTIMKVALCFGKTRGWLAGSPTVLKDSKRQPTESLFVMGNHGYLIEYTIRVKHSPHSLQEKVRDDETPLEIEVESYAQWPLLRETTNAEVRLPLHISNPVMIPLAQQSPPEMHENIQEQQCNPEEKWMAQVEIQTYSGPNRRLWMGPQFAFKTVLGSGNLNTIDMLSQNQNADDDPSLEFPPRSLPVNISSKNHVYIEARSHSCSVESEGEYDRLRVANQLQFELAEAMNDNLASNYNQGSISDRMGSSATELSSLDMSDVMDITCDPVGPSMGSQSIPQKTHIKKQEDELQSVTAKLRQVAVTSRSFEDNEGLIPWGRRTPSLTECKAMTSSGEELNEVLNPSSVGVIEIDSWSPLDQMVSISPDPIVESSSYKATSEPWGGQMENMFPCDEELSSSNVSSQKQAWGTFVESKPTLSPAIISTTTSDSFPSMAGSSNSKSATTSEDDLWSAREGKKDRKKKRKPRNKVEDSTDTYSATSASVPIIQQPLSYSEKLSSAVGFNRELSSAVGFNREIENSSPPIIDIEPEHFHTAEEFPQSDSGGNLIDIDSFDLEEETRDPVMMQSIHDNPDDLAKALEEASSDESSLPVRTRTGGDSSARGGEADEMFPFKETSSDEDDVSGRVRRRAVLTAAARARTFDNDDEDRDTSGDDRKTTSESDVTTSPNPRATANGKSKKKKKKRK